MRPMNFLGGLAGFQLYIGPDNSNNGEEKAPQKVASYHDPPPGVDYADNPSVFGRILRGEIASADYAETPTLLAFRDRTPRASLHALIIPKAYVRDVYSLGPGDVGLVEDMRAMALDVIREHHEEALETGDYTLCFHVPPYNSVDHLHMHVLAPRSEMNFVFRDIKYRCPTRWCTLETDVIRRLKDGLPAVPYNKSSWF
mmetsp:Transcript_33659/g.75983  ORF Transcript_33659/g.75983 Transcript_33659/m.75983 type:complete len:199 (-) Transcript_33659:887-1483(-)